MSISEESKLRSVFEACVIPVWRRHIWLAILAVKPLATGGQVAGIFIAQHRWGFAWGWTPILCGVLGASVGVQIFIQFIFERSRPHIRKYLDEVQDV